MSNTFEYKLFSLTRHFKEWTNRDHPDNSPAPDFSEFAEHLEEKLGELFDELDAKVYNDNEDWEIVSHNVVINGFTVLLSVIARLPA